MSRQGLHEVYVIFKGLREIWRNADIVHVVHVEMDVQLFVEFVHELVVCKTTEIFMKLPVVFDVFFRLTGSSVMTAFILPMISRRTSSRSYSMEA